MRERIRKILSFGVCLIFLASGFVPGYTGSPPPAWMDVGGFRGLPWGATTETAKAFFRDLVFAKYAINAEREPPSSVYERRNDDKRIDGIRVDEILYWFRNNSFYKVTVVLGSKFGPRTLETPALVAFERLSAAINGVAGPPNETRTHPGTWNTDRKSVWHHADMVIALSCLDPPNQNREELILEIVKCAAPKERAPK